MKSWNVKTLFATAVLLVCFQAYAEFSAGVNLSASMDRQVRKQEVGQGTQYQRTTTSIFNVYPSIIIPFSYRMEIVPTVGITIVKEKRVDEDPDGSENEQYNRSDMGIGGGCGLFFRLIDGDVLRLSLGPDLFLLFNDPDGDDNGWFDASIGLPVNVDFLLSDRVFLRLSSRLVTIGYAKQDQGQNTTVSNVTFFDIESMLQARLGFYFNF
ncbi:MAG: hypothetical protein JXA71_17335 [Chitinispirillaceae bacterium]|nr:hypothetical protein [Chitinispirillaceae bacterium]